MAKSRPKHMDFPYAASTFRNILSPALIDLRLTHFDPGQKTQGDSTPFLSL